MSTTALPTPPKDALVYKHPQGKTIYVLSDGSMVCFKPDGATATSSATPAKLAAGYGGWMLISGATPPKPYVAPVGAEHSTRGVRLAMTFGAAEVEDLRALALGPNMVVEQKLDGTRCLAVIAREAAKKPYVRFLGRNGQVLKHATAAQHFANLADDLERLLKLDYGEIVLDGEIMQDGTFWVFDLPYAKVNDEDVTNPTETWVDRHCQLVDVAERFEGDVRLLQTALDPDTKEQLISEVEATGGEGLMVKHALSPYEAGVRVKHSLKVKYVKTADVVVLARDVGGKKNAALGIFNPTTSMYDIIGNCSMIGKPDAKVGDVIEVKYLYLGAGGRLYQPRMERIRTDRIATSCGMDQFAVYTKAVIE